MELSDKDILDSNVGGQTIRDMSAISFFGWVSEKMNGLPTYSAANQELALAVSNPPMSRIYPENEKVRLARKLLSLGITL